MSDDGKIVAAILGITILVIGGASVINGRKNGSGTEASESPLAQVVGGLAVSPQPFDVGEVPYNGGIKRFKFKMKNETGNDLKLIRITTSCMCTQAAIKVGDKATDFFGMDMYGAGNPKIDVTLAAGSESELLVSFDPTAHGPQGIGPFDRSIRLEFADPAGYKDVLFNGTVINN